MNTTSKSDNTETAQMRDGKYMPGNRDKSIIMTSVISIAANILLAAFKAAVGIIANSISVTLDAVNNLSDALSGIITIVGTKLSGRPADKKHPYGYGRIEYISATVIAAIVLYAGFTALIESVKKIIHPEKAEYSIVSLVIITASVAVKLILGSFVKSRGEKLESKALEASGADARNDAVLSASVLASALIMRFTGISLEAYVGVIISVIILKSGFEMMKDTLDDILGSRISKELSVSVKKVIKEHKGVHGAYDLFLNSYGPDKIQGSVHIEVDADMTAHDIDALSSEIIEDVYLKTHVILTAVGVYSYNTQDEKAVAVKNEIRGILEKYDHILQMHGFYLDEAEKRIKFDVIIAFEAPDRDGEYEEILKEVSERYPDYSVRINLDADMSD